MRHKIAAALQLGPSALAGRAVWRMRQLVRTGRSRISTQRAADDFAGMAADRLADFPIQSFLPATSEIRACYSRSGTKIDDAIGRIAAVAERVCGDSISLRGIGELQLQFEQSNWYAYEAADAIMVNRHDFLIPLVQHYVLTESASSRRKINSLFDYWADNFDSRVLHGSDTPIDAAIRLINWLWVLNSDALDPDRVSGSKLAKVIYSQLEYIYSRFSAGGNHLVLEALALYLYGSVFRDTAGGARWRRWGRETLVDELARQTTADGIHTEQSMFYHQAVTTHFLKFFLGAAAFGDEPDCSSRDRFRRMLDYVHDSAMPNLTHPVIGDGEPLVTEDREHWEARALLAARWALYDQPVDSSLLSMIDDSSIWLLGCLSTDIGQAQDTLNSSVYSDSGLAVLRSKDAYVFVDAAPFSDPEFPHHGHADALSFVACVGREEIFVDPGGYGYYEDDFRRYFRGTAAHNTITLDGRDQSELFGVLGYGRLANAAIDDASLSDNYDYILASHDGYKPAFHSRALVLCKRPRKALIILDRLSGPGSHRGVSRFHAAPGVRINLETNQLVIPRSSASFCFAAAASQSLEQRVVCGKRDGQIQGWVSPETRKVVAAETWELQFDMDSTCTLVVAVSLEESQPVSAILHSADSAEVSVGGHVYSLTVGMDESSIQVS